MKKQLLSLVAFASIISSVHAQKINLVKDINPSGHSYPLILGAINNNAIFFADDGTTGFELWVSDGTATGTQILKDINPGPADCLDEILSYKANNKIFFSATEPTSDVELWVTDGTPTGTKMVKDINPGNSTGLQNRNFAYLNGNLFFNANNGTDGAELWMSDGTEQGTKMVKDIFPGTNSSDPSHFITALGKVFFSARDTNGKELWVTDGTPTGTKIVADLNSGSANASVSSIIAYNNKIYFVATGSSSNERELYSSDGTTITLVKNINATNSSSPRPLMIANNKLFFSARESATGNELWVTDGTEMGTMMVKDINLGTADADPYHIGALNGKLLFSAKDGTSGRKLWLTDGTATGTVLYSDFHVGSGSGVVNNISSEDLSEDKFVQVSNYYNGVYYFAGDDGKNGIELWRTNGTDTGTYMVDQVGKIPDTSVSSNLDYIFVDSNNVWLQMSDGTSGSELYLYKAPVPPTISVNNIDKNQQLTIYPNPGNGSFIVELPNGNFKNGYLSVSDISGKVIYDQSISPNATNIYIPLTNVPAGTYIVHTQLDGRTLVQKLVIQ